MSTGGAAFAESQRSRDKADALRRKAERLERRAVTFEQGRQGELLVSDALRPLIAYGFAYIDDVRWPGTTKSNIDHVLYGPPGMFAIDAKLWTGSITVTDGVLRQNRYRRHVTTDNAEAMAVSLQDQLGPSVGAVRPVVCMAGQPALEAAACGATVVVGLGALVPWLLDQPTIWPASHVEALSDWLPWVLEPAEPGGASTVTVVRTTASQTAGLT